MANHPLDISGLLKSKPTEGADHSREASSELPNTAGTSPSTEVRIQKVYWDQLNQESRRMLTSRVWKGIDFNPMLAELVDLSRITEKWLKWAVPTYVNGVQEGPIKDWLDGTHREKDFHYVLVGEHLKHLKELREQKRAEQQVDPGEHEVPCEEKETTASENHPVPSDLEAHHAEEMSSQELQASIETLDGHIRWFKEYLKERES